VQEVLPRVGTPAPEVQRLGYVHAQCLRDSGAGDRSPVVPRAAARRSQVVPRSKQLGSQAIGPSCTHDCTPANATASRGQPSGGICWQ
jgi:hypothetical protein